MVQDWRVWDVWARLRRQAEQFAAGAGIRRWHLLLVAGCLAIQAALYLYQSPSAPQNAFHGDEMARRIMLRMADPLLDMLERPETMRLDYAVWLKLRTRRFEETMADLMHQRQISPELRLIHEDLRRLCVDLRADASQSVPRAHHVDRLREIQASLHGIQPPDGPRLAQAAN